MTVPIITLTKTYATGTQGRVTVFWNDPLTDTLDNVVTPPQTMIQYITDDAVSFAGVPSTLYPNQPIDQKPVLVGVLEELGQGNETFFHYYQTPESADPVDVGGLQPLFAGSNDYAAISASGDAWIANTIVRGHYTSLHQANLAVAADLHAIKSDARGHIYDAEPVAKLSEVNQVQSVPGATFLAESTLPGATFFNLTNPPDVVQINTFVSIDPYTIRNELLRVTAIDGVKVTLDSALQSAHAAGTAVIFTHSPERSLNQAGAVGDGITDDTAAILATIAAVPEETTITGNGLRYRVSQTIVWDKLLHFKDIIFVEDPAMLALNMPGLTVPPDPPGVPVMWGKVKDDASSRADASRLSSIRIEGAQNIGNFIVGGSIQDSNRDGIRITGCADVLMTDIWVQNKAYGVKLDTCLDCHVDKLTVKGMYPQNAAQTTTGRNYHSGLRTRFGGGHNLTAIDVQRCGSSILLGGPSSSVNINGLVGKYLHDNGLYVSGCDQVNVTTAVIDTVYNGGTCYKIRGSNNNLSSVNARNGGVGLSISGYNTQQQGAISTTTSGTTASGASVINVGSATGFTAQHGIAHSGTLASATSSTATLDSSASPVQDYYTGNVIKIDSGTGAGQVRGITAYALNTRVATMSSAWSTTPDNTSVFHIFRGRLGTLASATSTTATLDSGASISDGLYNGLVIRIDSGTGSGQSRVISAYVGSTKTATVSAAWATTPDNTSVYYVFKPRLIWYRLPDDAVNHLPVWEYQPLAFVNLAANTLAIAGQVGLDANGNPVTGNDIANGRTLSMAAPGTDAGVDGTSAILSDVTVEHMTLDGINFGNVADATASPPLYMRNVQLHHVHLIDTANSNPYPEDPTQLPPFTYGAVRGTAYALTLDHVIIDKCLSALAAITLSGSAALPLVNLEINDCKIRGVSVLNARAMSLDYVLNGNIHDNILQDINGQGIVATNTTGTNFHHNNGLNAVLNNVVWLAPGVGNTGNRVNYNLGGTITVDQTLINGVPANLASHNSYDTVHDIGAGTYRGAAAVIGRTGATAAALTLNGANSAARQLLMQTDTVNRWILQTQTAESGATTSNIGSDLALLARGDAGAGDVGANNATAFLYERATGAATYGASQATPVATKTAAYTITRQDSTIFADAATIGAFTVTLPTAVGNNGRLFTIKRTSAGANNVTVGTTSSQQIDGATTYVLSAQFQMITVQSNNANWFIVAKV
jgi:hypothetical protein